MTETPNADYLRAPEDVCKPDVRVGFSAVPRDIEEQHKRAARYVLHKGVPEEVVVQFETAKNIYLYAWFVYRFYPVAILHASTCLELALRLRFEEEMLAAGVVKKRDQGPGLAAMFRYAIEQGYLKDEHFSAYHDKAQIKAESRLRFESIDEMRRLGLESMDLPDEPAEIKAEDYEPGHVQAVAERLRFGRNHFAHGSETLISQVDGTFQTVSEIINQIYMKSGSDL